MNFSDLVPYVSAFIMLVTLAGTALGFRPALFKAVAEIKDSTIASQKIEIEALARRVKSCEDATRITKRELYAVRYLFKQMGYYVTVDDGFVSAYDVSQKTTHTTQIRPLPRIEPDADEREREAEDAG